MIRGLPRPPSGLADVEIQAWIELVEGIACDPGIEWLSSLGAMRFADNKINQLRLAAEIGLPCPRTMVGAAASDIAAYVGEEAVIKPLGPGVVQTGGDEPRVFYSTKVDVRSLDDEHLARAPVVAQEPIAVDRHLRIVTVGKRVWCAALDAPGLPLDWREAPPHARRAWSRIDAPDEAREGALALAGAAELGFSSQDWLVEKGRCLFIDLNPNGGWLFLPDSVTAEIGRSIVDFLLEGAS